MPLGFARIEQRQEVRMLQVRRHAYFAEESRDSENRAQLGVQQLGRDAAIVSDVAREIHDGHATLTDLALDVVSAGERGPELLKGVDGHGQFRFAEAMRPRTSSNQFRITTVFASPPADFVKRKCSPSGITE